MSRDSAEQGSSAPTTSLNTSARSSWSTSLGTRRAVAAGLLLAALAVAFVAEISLGERLIAPVDVVAALRGAASPGVQFLVWELRAPRALAALLVGACLGASGAVTQSLLRNPLASPDILGVTTGAAWAVVAALLGGAGGLLAGAGLLAAACIGGAGAAVLVIVLAWQYGLPARRVVLVGLGVNAGLGAATSWTLLRADLPDLGVALRWLTGSLNDVAADQLPVVAVVVAVAVVGLALGTRTLEVLRMDKVSATALGVRVPRAQVAILSLAVVLAGAATAVAGPVGFIAFASPQVALLVFRTAGPPVFGGALVGALTLLLADLAARTVFWEPVPVGLVTALAGAPLLLWLLLRTR